MEPFVDFGLFEIAIATGLVWLCRHIFRWRLTAVVWLFASVALPVVLAVIATNATQRSIAIFALLCSAVNVTFIVPIVIRRSPLSTPLDVPRQ